MDMAQPKRKLVATMKERQIDENLVADLETSMAMLREQALKGTEVTLKDQNLEIMRRICPPFDSDTTDAFKIYSAQLDAAVAPEETLVNIQEDALVLLLGANCDKVRERSTEKLLPACSTETAVAVLRERAKEGVRENNQEEATRVAQRFAVLNCMVRFYANRKKSRFGHWNLALMS